MNHLISNNDHISTSALHGENIQHGLFSWGKHRYIKRIGTPGNYQYIYPEDLQQRRAARNNPRATLFGDSLLRFKYRTDSAYERKLARQQSRFERKQLRAQKKEYEYSVKASDSTRSEASRKKYAQKSLVQRSVVAALEKSISELKETRGRAQQRTVASKLNYNRSRKIDDVPRNIVETGSAFINAARRAYLSKKQERINKKTVFAKGNR